MLGYWDLCSKHRHFSEKNISEGRKQSNARKTTTNTDKTLWTKKLKALELSEKYEVKACQSNLEFIQELLIQMEIPVLCFQFNFSDLEPVGLDFDLKAKSH